MFNIQNMSFSIKEKKSSMKIYLSVLLFFLVTGMDGYACDKKGHIKFHNYTHTPITVTAFLTKDYKKVYPEIKIVRPKTTSGGICWYSKKHGYMYKFKTSFNYKGKTAQGPGGKISRTSTRIYARGRVRMYTDNNGYITVSGCNEDQFKICTVNLRIKK